jgi:hypothetical protein
LVGKGFSVALTPDKTIRAWHVSDDGDYENEAGVVIRNRKDPKLWGLRNASEKPWSMTNPNGEEKMIPDGGVVPIFKSVKISFGSVNAEIK